MKVSTDRGALRFWASDPLLVRRALDGLEKEPDTVRWIETFPPGSVFWDVGANVGLFSILAGSKDGLRVLAFEPLAANYHVLTKNIELNGLMESVAAYCLALASRSEVGTLNVVSQTPGAALSQFGDAGEASPYAGAGAVTTIQGMLGLSMDRLVGEFGAPPPNFVKIDVDGLEPEILQGGRSTLSNPEVASVVVELSLTELESQRRARNILESCGLRQRGRGPEQGVGALRAANFLFERDR